MKLLAFFFRIIFSVSITLSQGVLDSEASCSIVIRFLENFNTLLLRALNCPFYARTPINLVAMPTLFFFYQMQGIQAQDDNQPVHAANPNKRKLRKMAVRLEPAINANRRIIVPPTSRWTTVGECPKVAFYNMLNKYLHH